MKLMENVKIPSERALAWDFDGLFLKRDGTVKFCFWDHNSVVAVTAEGEREVWYTPPEGEMLPGPSRWDNACPGYPPVLNRFGTVDNTTEVYYFGDLAISHKSEWSYVCRRGGEPVWTFKGYAWRYTKIERCGDNIYFGTAGQGGYFYLLELHTGKPLLKLKTGGTVNIYARRENLLYLLQQEKKAYLVCIDLSDGTILERLELPGSVNDACAVMLLDDTVHAVTLFYKKDRSFSHACWNRIGV